MKKIGDLIGRFKNFVPPEKILKQIIVGVIKDATGVDVSLQEIEIARGIVRLKISSIKKTQILIKKEVVLEGLKEKLKDKSPRDLV